MNAPYPAALTAAIRSALAILVLLAQVLALLPANGSAHVPAGNVVHQSTGGHPFGDRTASIADRHVYDFAQALSDPEIVTIADDADRLQRFGMPAVIITMRSNMAPIDAAQMASSVREDWDIATSPGAGDGLVFLVVLPEAGDNAAYATLSWGPQALPLDGLNATISEHIYQQWISPWLAEPRVFEAVTYGLRRMIYHIIYDPGPPTPLTDARELMHNVVGWIGLLAIIAFLAVWAAARFGWGPRVPGLSSPSWLMELVPFVVIAALAIASVFGQSRAGIACAGLLLVGCLVAWMRRDPRYRAANHSEASRTAHAKGAIP